jgi:hypothetical protein
MFTEKQQRRVYLSKSNHAGSNTLNIVKDYLRELGYLVIEHQHGAEYNERLLYGCKFMVMVGWDEVDCNGEVYVGKGIFNQYRNRKQQEYHYNYYFDGLNDNKPILKGIQGNGAVQNESDWARYYGVLKLNMEHRPQSRLTIIKEAPVRHGYDVKETRTYGETQQLDSFSGKPCEIEAEKDTSIRLSTIRIVRSW